MRAAAIALLPAACAPPPAPAPTARPRHSPWPRFGETFSFESKLLGERRVINVYLPPDYAKTAARYPVLYMPDGGMAEDFPHVVGSVDVSIKNAVIRPVIVVGVENTERRRDLVGVTTVAEERVAAPHAGGADRFRAFLRDELKPRIAARYRTTAESALIGESLAGLFVIETFIVEPTLFDGYIAADPSVWWNEQAVVRSANAHLAWWSAGPRALYVATADAPEMADGVAILTTALRIYAPPVAWVYEPMPHEHHSTIFLDRRAARHPHAVRRARLTRAAQHVRALADALDLGEVIVGELDVRRADVLAHVLGVRGSGDDHDRLRAAQEPGERGLRGRVIPSRVATRATIESAAASAPVASG